MRMTNQKMNQFLIIMSRTKIISKKMNLMRKKKKKLVTMKKKKNFQVILKCSLPTFNVKNSQKKKNNKKENIIWLVMTKK